jgi:uncharacterized protein (DUF58 family)
VPPAPSKKSSGPSNRLPLPFDWASLATLRLRARAVADGVYAGMHASTRKGSGVEFGGHRAYVPGDDLRLLDRRAMARHDKPYIRELQTETDRALRLLVDASASMGFRGSGPVTKLEYAATLAAALGRVALSSGDPVGLDFIGGAGGAPLPAGSGRESFERLVSSLEVVKPAGDVTGDIAAVDRAIAPIARRARRGSIILLLSDLVDLHPDALRRFVALGTGGRTLLVLRVLDPDEATFPYDGPVRLRSVENYIEVETDPDAVRAGYLEALAAVAEGWSKKLLGRGGRLLMCTTGDEPVAVVRSLMRASAEGAR